MVALPSIIFRWSMWNEGDNNSSTERMGQAAGMELCWCAWCLTHTTKQVVDVLSLPKGSMYGIFIIIYLHLP